MYISHVDQVVYIICSVTNFDINSFDEKKLEGKELKTEPT